MTDETELEKLRERIEELENEVGIDRVPDVDELIDRVEYGKTWLSVDDGPVSYFIPVGAVTLEGDGFADSDTKYRYDYAVRVNRHGDIGTYTDKVVRTNANPETMSYKEVRDRLREVVDGD